MPSATPQAGAATSAWSLPERSNQVSTWHVPCSAVLASSLARGRPAWANDGSRTQASAKGKRAWRLEMEKHSQFLLDVVEAPVSLTAHAWAATRGLDVHARRKAEAAGYFSQMLCLLFEAFSGSGRLLNESGVLLRHFVELADGRLHLRDSAVLPCSGHRDLTDDGGQALDRGHDL